jgi:hypothetical protein
MTCEPINTMACITTIVSKGSSTLSLKQEERSIGDVQFEGDCRFKCPSFCLLTSRLAMSLITLQLGQCGNQLGYDIHSLLASELLQPGRLVASDVFFRQTAAGHHVARTLLLDMEPKVVNSCILRANLASNSWKYNPRNVVVQQSGSGARTWLNQAECHLDASNGSQALARCTQSTTT